MSRDFFDAPFRIQEKLHSEFTKKKSERNSSVQKSGLKSYCQSMSPHVDNSVEEIQVVVVIEFSS